MTKPKLTPWYPASIEPVRVGVYEFQFKHYPVIFFYEWDGCHFRVSDGIFKGKVIYCISGDKWRGLAAKP